MSQFFIHANSILLYSQRIRCTVDEREQKKLMMDLEVKMVKYDMIWYGCILHSRAILNLSVNLLSFSGGHEIKFLSIYC